MQTYATNEARRQLGKLLEAAQRDEVPFMLRVRQQEAAVAAPSRWFKRACRALGEEPDQVPAKERFNEVRNDLAPMATRVLFQEEFFRITRLGFPAIVLVPISWYERAVTQAGPPAGDPPKEDTGAEDADSAENA